MDKKTLCHFERGQWAESRNLALKARSLDFARDDKACAARVNAWNTRHLRCKKYALRRENGQFFLAIII